MGFKPGTFEQQTNALTAKLVPDFTVDLSDQILYQL